ncbi:hypothetical protein GCM10010294_25100 [Streptomyces griseoloalbus]|uniref:hypothetical protein n=1 Tax=Streptomyces griseoloalbus TaxID=67303 RepID=UPI001874544E|nr:hypothetical protein GCM10010294_25100 [Streptomyces griseoloalbus]
MGFMKDRAKEVRQAMDDGDVDRAAELTVHALLEGPTTRAELLAELPDDDSK